MYAALKAYACSSENSSSLMLKILLLICMKIIMKNISLENSKKLIIVTGNIKIKR